ETPSPPETRRTRTLAILRQTEKARERPSAREPLRFSECVSVAVPVGGHGVGAGRGIPVEVTDLLRTGAADRGRLGRSSLHLGRGRLSRSRQRRGSARLRHRVVILLAEAATVAAAVVVAAVLREWMRPVAEQAP